METKKRFMEAWEKYFPGNELPVATFYADKLNGVEFPKTLKPNAKGYTCIFSQIAPVRKGHSRAFNKENLGCFSSFLPFGFDFELSEDVKNYVCNVERVKKSYDLLEKMYELRPPAKAPKKYIIFKHWDTLEEQDNPQVVTFFGN